MRWYGQLAVIAVLGAAGYGGWYAYKSGHLSAVPVLGAYLPGAGAPAQGQRPPQGPPPVVEVDTVRTGRVVETREAIGTVRAFESEALGHGEADAAGPACNEGCLARETLLHPDLAISRSHSHQA